jgi:lambda family phage tail tape measure protein
MSGRWANLRGSASIFLGAAGMGGLAGTGVVMGLTAAVEGIEALTESIQEAAQAQKDLQQSAILSGNAGALFSGKIDAIVNGLQTIKDASYEVKEKFVTNALNSGLSPEFIKKYGSELLQYQQEFGDKQTEALEKIIAEAQTNATKGYAALYKMGDGLLDKVNNDIQSGNYKAAGADIISQLMQGAQNELRESQKNNHELDGDSWLDTALQYMGMGSLGYSAAGVEMQHKILKGIQQKKDAVIDAGEQARNAIKKSVDSVKPIDLSHTKAYSEFEKFYHPSFSGRHGLTDAQKAAKKAQEWLNQMESMNNNIIQSNKNRMDSLNRSFENKTYQFSMTGDYHNFMTQLEQENEYADNLINTLNQRYTRANKPHDAEYKKALQNINLGRQQYLQQAQDDYDQLETINQSSLDGMEKAWITYSDNLNNIMSESAATYKDVLDDMQSMLVNFLDTGELDIDKFLKAVLTDFQKMFVEQDIMKPMNSFIGGMFGWNAKGVDTTNAAYSAGSGLIDWASGLLGATRIPLPDVGATRGVGLGSTAPTINITINDNGNKGVDSKVNANSGDMQKLGIALDKFMQNYIKQQNVASNRQGGVNKVMGNWTTK